MKLWPATSEDPDLSGFICEFPSGVRKQIAWRSRVPITPELQAAKQYAATLIQALMSEGRLDDVERTNWASATAAIQRLVSDFNDKCKARLYATGGTTPAAANGTRDQGAPAERLH
jgi:hypothetical protein